MSTNFGPNSDDDGTSSHDHERTGKRSHGDPGRAKRRTPRKRIPLDTDGGAFHADMEHTIRRTAPSEEEIQSQLEEVVRKYGALDRYVKTRAKRIGYGRLVEAVMDHCRPREPGGPTQSRPDDQLPPPGTGGTPATGIDSTPLIEQLAKVIEESGILATLPPTQTLPFPGSKTHHVKTAVPAVKLAMEVIVRLVHSEHANRAEPKEKIDFLRALFNVSRDPRSRKVIGKIAARISMNRSEAEAHKEASEKKTPPAL